MKSSKNLITCSYTRDSFSFLPPKLANQGLSVFKIDENGQFSLSFTDSTVENPAFCVNFRNLLFVASENIDIQDEIFVFEIIREEEKEQNNLIKELKFLQKVSTFGQSACYLTFAEHNNQDFLLCVNYWDSTICCYKINSSDLQPLTLHQVIPGGKTPPNKQHHEGKNRHTEAHFHSIIQDSKKGHKNYVYVGNLGTDNLKIYNFSNKHSKLYEVESVCPGFAEFRHENSFHGPRHLAIHSDPDLDILYAANEISATVSVYQMINKENDITESGRLKLIQTIPTKGHDNPAGIFILNNHLLTSNRGSDTISIFPIDKSTGKLSEPKLFDSGVNIPRGFTIDEESGRVVVCGQNSNDLVMFSFDSERCDLEVVSKIDVDCPNFALVL